MAMLGRVSNPSVRSPEANKEANKKFVEHIREMAVFTGAKEERDEHLGTPWFII